MSRIEIPAKVIATVADVLGNFYYNHTKLNTLFLEAGAPEEIPGGNCVDKSMQWLTRCNEDTSIEPLDVLGRVIESFMDSKFFDEFRVKGQKRIKDALSRSGMAYQKHGVILVGGSNPTAKTLAEMLQHRDFSAVGKEFDRALEAVESDPPAGITAACALIEALCKAYIEIEDLPLPSKQTIKELWSVIRDDLGFDPGAVADDDIKRIVSGLISIVDGVGSLRTHAGSAHGRSSKDRKILPHEARLAIHAAHTLAIFLIQTWELTRNNEGRESQTRQFRRK